ncbi:MAG: paraquat-inducible protein A [Planctomycetota bacterium]
MSAPLPQPDVAGCPACGLLQRVPFVAQGHRARCPRCQAVVLDPDRRRRSRSHALAWALGGLILFPVAISLPIAEFEQFGATSSSSVLGGTLGLLAHGEYVVGGVVLFTSVLLPVTKLASIAALAFGLPRSEARRARLHHAVEVAGRWGMLDVFLIAALVAALKLGDLVEVTPGPGAWAFCLLVALSLLASAAFDPHDFWAASPARRDLRRATS